MLVWGPVVWIPGIPENVRNCYLGVAIESQTTGPQTTSRRRKNFHISARVDQLNSTLLFFLEHKRILPLMAGNPYKWLRHHKFDDHETCKRLELEIRSGLVQMILRIQNFG